MKEKKNIDRIFQEKFKDFETEPHERVWDNIASKLDKKDKKRPLIIPLWFKIGGVAAIMAIILASLLFTNNQNSVTGEPEVVFENPEKSTQEQNSNKESSAEKNKNANISEEEIVSEEKAYESENDEINAASNNKSSSNSALTGNENNSSQEKIKNNNIKSDTPIHTESAIADKEKKSKSSNFTDSDEELVDSEKETRDITSEAIAASETTAKDSVKTQSIIKEENALADVEEEKKKREENEEDIADLDSRKMRLSTFAAPVFYKNIGSGNELSNQLSDNSTSSEVTLAYGVKIAYKISDKLKIRTGISKIDINKNIQDISYSPSAMSVGFENISPLEDNIQIRDNSPGPSENGLPIGGMDGNNSFTTAIVTTGEINQQFGYIEVPLEIEYVLIDSKFGLNIIGGGSSLFLDNNRVQLISGEMKTDLGKATNINNTSFSTNIGVGMDYQLTDKFSINVEPIFKYQINTFNNVNNVQPVNFGVYSGLSFRF